MLIWSTIVCRALGLSKIVPIFSFYFASASSSIFLGTQGFSSVQFSLIVMSDSLWPPWTVVHQASLSILTPGACSKSCPLSRWCHLTISSSVIPFFCLQSFPASESFPVNQFFTSIGQSIEISPSASVLPMNIQN